MADVQSIQLDLRERRSGQSEKQATEIVNRPTRAPTLRLMIIDATAGGADGRERRELRRQVTGARMAAEVGGQVSTVSTAWAVFSVIGGSLIGAGISAGMAYFTLRKNINAAKANRDEDRFELRKARGYALFFKMIRLTSDLHTLGNAVKSCFADAERDGFKWAPFQIVRPIVPLPDPVQFAPEEMALVLSIDSNLFNEMGALDELHKSTVALFNMYNTERTRIMERFGANMEGPVGTTGLTEQEKNWLAPRAFQLNQLIELMLKRTEQDGEEAWSALEKLHAALEKNFNLRHKLERKVSPSTDAGVAPGEVPS